MTLAELKAWKEKMIGQPVAKKSKTIIRKQRQVAASVTPVPPLPHLAGTIDHDFAPDASDNMSHIMMEGSKNSARSVSELDSNVIPVDASTFINLEINGKDEATATKEPKTRKLADFLKKRQLLSPAKCQDEESKIDINDMPPVPSAACPK